MSFQDVRRRQHPIFDNHRRIGNTANTSSTTTGTGTMQRIEGDDQQLESSRRPTLITTRSSSSSNKNNNNNNHHHHHHHRHKSRSSPSPQQQIKPQRGVRPRLSTTCPVTAKNLMDDQASSGTQETAPSVDTLSSQDEAEIPSLLSPQRDMTASRSLSIFAHLTTSIVNFQKMVAELESLLEDSGISPEAQWRTRILIHSAQDADQDIQTRLYQLDESSHTSSRAQVALRKLHRDFGRVHKDLRKVLALYQRKQQVEVSFLSKDETKEEFFDRAMREREQEVTKIHQSMNQVNAIYQDLAGLVDDQQDQIDRIGDATDEAKANTRSGLEHVQYGFAGLCGPLGGGGGGQVDKKPTEEGYRVQEEFKWSMPFETLGDDMRAVQADVFQFGRELIEDLQDTMIQGRLSVCSQNFDCNEQVELIRFENACTPTHSGGASIHSL